MRYRTFRSITHFRPSMFNFTANHLYIQQNIIFVLDSQNNFAFVSLYKQMKCVKLYAKSKEDR